MCLALCVCVLGQLGSVWMSALRCMLLFPGRGTPWVNALYACHSESSCIPFQFLTLNIGLTGISSLMFFCGAAVSCNFVLHWLFCGIRQDHRVPMDSGETRVPVIPSPGAVCVVQGSVVTHTMKCRYSLMRPPRQCFVVLFVNLYILELSTLLASVLPPGKNMVLVLTSEFSDWIM